MTRWPDWLIRFAGVHAEHVGDLLSRPWLRVAAKANAEYWRRRREC